MDTVFRRIPVLLLLLTATLGGARTIGQTVNEPIQFSGTRLDEPGTYTISSEHQGLHRYFLLHVPPQVAADAPLPLVLCLHGAGANAEQIRQATELDATADNEGFIVMYPAGSGKLGTVLLTWNAGPTCCGYSVEENIDDVGFIDQTLTQTATLINVDHTRVYVTGFSNGAMMCYRLAHEIGRRFAAIAPVAGVMAFEPFGPKVPLPIMQIHSIDDPLALYLGGVSHLVGLAVRITHFPVEAALQQWISYNGCTAESTEVATISGRPDSSNANQTATCYRYDNQQNGAEVVLWKLQGCGHVWPGRNPAAADASLGQATSILTANDAIWQFFRQHSRIDAPPLSVDSAIPSTTPAEEPIESNIELSQTADPFEPLGPVPQAVFEFYFAKSALSLDYDGTNSSELEDWDGEVQSQKLEATATVALYSRLALGSNTHSVFSILFNCKAQYHDLDFEPYHDFQLWRGSIGLSALYVSNANNLYYLFTGVAAAEDAETVEEPSLLPVVVGLGTHRYDHSHTLLYGGVVTSVYGKVLPLPMIGYTLINPYGFRFATLLPIFLTFGYKFDNNLELYAFCVPDGGFYNLDDSWQGTCSDELQLRITQLRAGLLGVYPLSADVKLQFGSGVITARTLTILDGDATIDETTALPGVYVNAGLQVLF